MLNKYFTFANGKNTAFKLVFNYGMQANLKIYEKKKKAFRLFTLCIFFAL